MDIKHKLKLLTPLLLYAVFYIAAFALLEKIDRTGWISPSLEIDDMIPFVPVFIIQYVFRILDCRLCIISRIIF